MGESKTELTLCCAYLPFGAEQKLVISVAKLTHTTTHGVAKSQTMGEYFFSFIYTYKLEIVTEYLSLFIDLTLSIKVIKWDQDQINHSFTSVCKITGDDDVL